MTGDIEAQFNLRPMWRRYDRLQIINWLVEIVDNVATLTQITLVEPATVRVGAFGTKTVVRYRDLRLIPMKNGDGTTTRIATWTLRELSDQVGTSDGSFNQIGAGIFQNREGDTRATLPVAIAYTGRTDAPMESAIPLMGVAWANLAHWQLSTSLRFNSEVAGFAQPTVIGDLAADPTTGLTAPLGIGPLVSVQLQAGGDFKFVEAAGTGLDRLGQLVLEKLRQIAALGVSFLMSDTRAAETAEAKRLDAAAENATLATAATAIQDADNLALEIHAWYLGIEKAGAPVLTISHDFESTTMQADVMQAYAALVAQGFPKRLVLEALQAEGRIASDAKLEELEIEWEANVQAVGEQKRLDALANQPTPPPTAKGDPTRAGSSPPTMTIEYGANGRPARIVPAA